MIIRTFNNSNTATIAAVIMLMLAMILGAIFLEKPHTASAQVTILRTEYDDLRRKAETLPKEQKHNEHLAGTSTDLVKENIELKSRLATCAADKDAENIRKLLSKQDEQITAWRDRALEAEHKLNGGKP